MKTNRFIYNNNQKSLEINHMIYCNGKSLIYLITYDRCLKQHVGQTIDEFRYRRNSYEDNPSMFERREDRLKKHWELGVNVGDKNK